MVYTTMRFTVADYEKWRLVFDANDAFRRAGGAIGAPQVYRDVDNPNVITVLGEWDTAENFGKFTRDPALAEKMKEAGVMGPPSLIAVMSRA